jgi:hypothetical protein
MLADRPRAVVALTKIFPTEIEQHLLAASGGASDAETPRASRPRLGGISFLHRFGSPISFRRRGSTGIAITGCLRRITS